MRNDDDEDDDWLKLKYVVQSTLVKTYHENVFYPIRIIISWPRMVLDKPLGTPLSCMERHVAQQYGWPSRYIYIYRERERLIDLFLCHVPKGVKIAFHWLETNLLNQ